MSENQLMQVYYSAVNYITKIMPRIPLTNIFRHHSMFNTLGYIYLACVCLSVTETNFFIILLMHS